MSYSINPIIESVSAPPIADVQAWVTAEGSAPDKPLLDVAQAVPSYPPAEALIDHIRQVAELDPTSVYTEILGLPLLREALCAHMNSEYDCNIDPCQVGITAGCNQAFCVTMTALAEPGDEVILPLPYYFNHHMWLQAQGIRPVCVPIMSSDGSSLTPATFAQHITSRTRAITLITPNNPTGITHSSDELDALYEIAAEHQIALVIDETYKDFRADPAPPHRLFQQPDWADNFVQLYSFSKAYSMTGYRIGSVIGSQRLLSAIEKILDCVAICPSHIGQQAALFAVNNLSEWRRQKAGMMTRRMQALHQAFRSNELRYQLCSAGAYFAYICHPFADEPATDVAKRLARQENILCLPGPMFGPQQKRYLRFAFANLATEQIPELIKRLINSQG